jgi:hypothetical protein
MNKRQRRSLTLEREVNELIDGEHYDEARAVITVANRLGDITYTKAVALNARVGERQAITYARDIDI